MSDTPENVEYAFPVVFPTGNANGGPYVRNGMTLRQWFAGQALPGIIAATYAQCVQNEARHGDICPTTAAIAIDFADAMIAALKPEASHA